MSRNVVVKSRNGTTITEAQNFYLFLIVCKPLMDLTLSLVLSGHLFSLNLPLSLLLFFCKSLDIYNRNIIPIY